jgi:hypothetical protein
MSKFETFCKVLIMNSKADEYHQAINEWAFSRKFYDETNCICNQHISNCYEVKNKCIDNRTLVIGNICIKKFMSENKNLVDKVKVTDYNEKALEKNKLYKKCICGEKFKLKDLGEHSWKHKCLKCYLNKK